MDLFADGPGPIVQRWRPPDHLTTRLASDLQESPWTYKTCLRPTRLASDYQTCLIIQGMVWFGVVSSGLVWSGLVWFGVVWYGVVWFGTYGLAGFGVV